MLVINIHDKIVQIRNLVSRSRLEKAIETMQNLANEISEKELRRNILLICANYHNSFKQNLLNIENDKETRNKAVLFLLYSLDQIEDDLNIEPFKENLDLIEKVEKSDISIIYGFDNLMTANVQIVEEAELDLVATGSRSRDLEYLKSIESKLKKNPKLNYYRILYGMPHNDIFKRHLKNLLNIQKDFNKHTTSQTIFLSLFDIVTLAPETFICANEKRGIVILPSFKGLGHYDTALEFKGAESARNLINYAKSLYDASRIKLSTQKEIDNLIVI